MPTFTVRAPALGRPLIALLIDPDADTREMYGEYLRTAPCEIVEAENGPDALAKAISRHPDVIVTETRLPGIDGFDLCRLLRKEISTLSIPIIVVTGDALPADVARARTAGADAVLVKPCLPETLRLEIGRVLGRGPLSRGASATRRRTRRPAVERSATMRPQTPPAALVCPACDRPLTLQRSHIGGVHVRDPERWDYYHCAGGCGTYEYRHRTRQLRLL